MTICDVAATRLPREILLHARVAPSDFLDCYSIRSDATPRRAAEIIADFPVWVRQLMGLRRIITAPFGLLNDGPDAIDKVGPFPVECSTSHEPIAGFNDRHLDFRIAVFAKDGEVSLATWVRPHNVGGRLYLSAILPFHTLIARDALARVSVTL